MNCSAESDVTEIDFCETCCLNSGTKFIGSPALQGLYLNTSEVKVAVQESVSLNFHRSSSFQFTRPHLCCKQRNLIKVSPCFLINPFHFSAYVYLCYQNILLIGGRSCCKESLLCTPLRYRLKMAGFNHPALTKI